MTRPRKLRLGREALSELSADDLVQIAGGSLLPCVEVISGSCNAVLCALSQAVCLDQGGPS